MWFPSLGIPGLFTTFRLRDGQNTHEPRPEFEPGPPSPGFTAR